MTSTDQKPTAKPTDRERGISADDRHDRDREAAEGPLAGRQPAPPAHGKGDKKNSQNH